MKDFSVKRPRVPSVHGPHTLGDRDLRRIFIPATTTEVFLYYTLEVVVAHKKQRIQADSRPSTSRRGLGNGSRKSKKPAMRALGAPLKEKKGMSIPVVCHCILINTQQHTNLSLCTFLPTGTNQTWRRCPITSSSKSSSTLLTRCITRTCKLPLLYPGS